MNPLSKKCVLFSAVFHSLLLGIVLFGSALMPREKAPVFHPIQTFDPDKILITLNESKGSPAVAPPIVPAAVVQTPPPAPQPQPAQPVEPTPPPAPQPVRPTPVARRDPEPPPVRVPQTQSKFVIPAQKPKPAPERQTTAKPPEPQRSVKKPEPHRIELDPSALKQINKKPVKTTSKPTPTPSRNREQEEAQAREYAANRQRANQIKSAIQGLSDKTSARAPVAVPVFGDAGPESVAYSDLVGTKYTDAWVPPPDLDDDNATAIVKVTISRDGRVINAQIIKSSGNRMMDKSVQVTLEKVTFIAPFPAGTPDQQRTYNINFNLSAKRSLG